MLFSIELTAVHYRLEHLSGAFVAVTYGLALVAVGVRPLLSSALGGTDPLSLFSTAFPPTSLDLAHLCLFALLGVASALAAAALLHLLAAALDHHGALVTKAARWRHHGALVAAVVAAAVAACACAAAALLLSDDGECNGFFAEGGSQTLDHLFSVDGRWTQADQRVHADHADHADRAHPPPQPVTKLLLYGALRLGLLIPASLCLRACAG